MFVKAVQLVSYYTRPVFTISRAAGATGVTPGAATLFFVNEEGWAVTTKRIAGALMVANKKDSPHEIKLNFVDCVDVIKGITCKLHPTLDLALIHFEGYSDILYKPHAVFAPYISKPVQGKSLCRLGFPFPEFNNYKYDAENDTIVWTMEGKKTSPRFALEGMVTRLVGNDTGISGFELSTPGYEGMSGGPVFDKYGLVHGMYVSNTKLGFAHCVHMDSIKAFMKQEGVYFVEDDCAEIMATRSDKDMALELLKKGPPSSIKS